MLELQLTRVSSAFSQDSLAAEIEGTMRKELQLEEPESPDIAYGLTSELPRGTAWRPVVVETSHVWASGTHSDHCGPSTD